MNRTLQYDKKLISDPLRNRNSFGHKKFSTTRSDTEQKTPRELKTLSSRGEPRADGMITISPKGYLKKALPPASRAYVETEAVKTKMVELESRVYDMKNITIPRNLKYSSHFKDNSIDSIRQKLRLNQIMHKKYDADLEGRRGRKYYEGVYEPNNPKHVEENEISNNETKNLYKFLVNERVTKPKVKISIQSQSKQNEWRANTISEQERIYRSELKKLRPAVIFGLLQALIGG